jgi:hypothetical protein
MCMVDKTTNRYDVDFQKEVSIVYRNCYLSLDVVMSIRLFEHAGCVSYFVEFTSGRWPLNLFCYSRIWFDLVNQQIDSSMKEFRVQRFAIMLPFTGAGIWGMDYRFAIMTWQWKSYSIERGLNLMGKWSNWRKHYLALW